MQHAISSDQDRDAYYVDLSYKAPFGKTTGALWAVRNAIKIRLLEPLHHHQLLADR